MSMVFDRCWPWKDAYSKNLCENGDLFFFARVRAIDMFAKCFCPNNSTTTHYDNIDYGVIATS